MQSFATHMSVSRDGRRLYAFARVACCLLAAGSILTMAVAWGRGKPAVTPPNPDIVYMSSSSARPHTTAIRGVALDISGEVITSTDGQLLKALNGRNNGSLAWSPDGSRYAWIEGGSPATARIMWARPGQPPRVLYEPVGADDPLVDGNWDTLDWGGACSGDGSVLVFARTPTWDPAIEANVGGIMALDIAYFAPDSNEVTVNGSPRLLRETVANAFAFSPTGRYLAYSAGYGANQRVAALPMCVAGATPTVLLALEDLGAAKYSYACDTDPGCPCNGDATRICEDYPNPAVISADWSNDGERLALSVTVGPDPSYPWRDLRVAYLTWNELLQAFQKDHVTRIDFDANFGAASSEGSPHWGTGTVDRDCERLVFAQSGGVIDGSTMNGRTLYVHDLVGSNAACLVGPREIAARDPRAIDWK